MIEREQYDIEVELTLLPAEESGLKEGIFSGTRSYHVYLHNIRWIAALFLPDRKILLPGETSRAFVRFIYRPDLLAGRLHLGKPFLLTNGRAIGKGVILSLLHFEKHAAEAKQQEEERTTLLSDPKKHITSYQEHPHRRLRKKKRKSK